MYKCFFYRPTVFNELLAAMSSVDLPKYSGRSFCVQIFRLNREHMFAILGSSKEVIKMSREENELEKVYVQVDSERTENGDVIPLAIAWADGRVWKIDRCQARAAIKGILTYGRYTFWEIDRCQACAAIKGFLTYGRYALGNTYRSQAYTTLKGALTNGRNRIWEYYTDE